MTERQTEEGSCVHQRQKANSMKHINIIDSIECILIEINVAKKKYMLIRTNRPPSQREKFIFNEMSKVLDSPT